MKTSDWNTRLERLLPLGIPFRGMESKLIFGGLAVASLWSLGIPTRYLSARSQLFRLRGRIRQLIPGAVMIPFGELIQSGLLGFELFLLGMVLLGLAHHAYHRRDSMSVYLMKRLPDPREYYLRCWSIPVLAGIAAVALAAILLGIYYLIYLTCTPAQCLR